MHPCCCGWVAKSCLTLCDALDCRPPGSSIHEISQARKNWSGLQFPSLIPVSLLLQAPLPSSPPHNIEQSSMCHTVSRWFFCILIKTKGEEGDRGWGGWMASLIQWTWTWANSGRRWGTRKPGVLQSVGFQNVGRDLSTKQQHSVWSLECVLKGKSCDFLLFSNYLDGQNVAWWMDL